MKRQEGAQVEGVRVGQAFHHIVANDFRIAHDHGAVEAVVPAAFLGAVLDAGVEDAVYAFFQQVFDVPVDEFGRIAGRIGGNRVHGLFKQLLGGRVGQDDGVAQLGEEGKPEGIIFVHVQHAGNTDGTAGTLLQRFVPIEQEIVLDLVHVGQGFFAGCRRAGSAPFAAVARNEGTAVVEGVDRQQAIVGAQAAVANRRGDR